MHLLLRVLGSAAIAIGVIWILQGVGILPGSFMTGQMRWAGYGALLAAVGLVVLIRFRRR